MELHYKITGIILILLGLMHLGFPKYFKWASDLKSLSLINRQMMVIHTFFIGLTVILMGLLCLSATEELLHTNLGHKISLGLGIFWGLRLIIQFIGYSPALWKGKTFETIIHIAFTCLWLYFTWVFLSSSIIQ